MEFQKNSGDKTSWDAHISPRKCGDYLTKTPASVSGISGVPILKGWLKCLFLVCILTWCAQSRKYKNTQLWNPKYYALNITLHPFYKISLSTIAFYSHMLYLTYMMKSSITSK